MATLEWGRKLFGRGSIGVGVDVRADLRADFGNTILKVGAVGAVEAMVAGLLAEHHVHLGHLVVVVVMVMVEVLLIEVKYYPNMWGLVDILELVARELGNDECLLVNLVEDVEKGYAYVAGQDGAMLGAESLVEYVVDKSGGSALAFGAGDSNSEVVIDLKKDIGLRGDGAKVATPLELHGRDAWGFDDKVVGLMELGGLVEIGKDFIIATGNVGGEVWNKPLKHCMGAFAFASIAGDKDSAAKEDIDELLLSKHMYR